MILSRFKLDIRNVYGRKCVEDCQIMHRSVMRLFHCQRQAGKVLYRFHSQKQVVYILSEKEPDLEDIPAGMHFERKKDMSAWEAQLEEGQSFRFNLLASPTKKVAMEGANNSRRRFLRSQQERVDWLNRKAEQAGFSLVQVHENADEKIAVNQGKDSGGRFYCHAVSYQGILTILDKDKFHEAWKNGIGSGKAYGQGLLLLAGV